jgi:hypothetical protein
MANTVSIISYANTFADWVVSTNALAKENNDIAANNYVKPTGTLYLNDPTLGLQVANNAVFAGQLLVQGIGSSAYVQNNLQVGQQVYFTNTVLGLVNSGQANIGGLLLASGSGTGLIVSNNATIGGNTSILGNTALNIVNANTITVTNLYNSYLSASFAAANLALYEVQYAWSQANTATIVAVGSFNEANAAFNTANNVFAAGSYANSAFLNSNGAFTQANAAYGSQNTTGFYANSSYVQANAAFIQANAAYTRANNSLNANTGGTITGPVHITSTLTVDQALVLSGGTVTDSNSFTLRAATGTADGVSSTFAVNRGTSANAILRWNDANTIWDLRDVNFPNNYYQILTTNNVSNNISAISTLSVASSNAVNTVYTYSQSVFTQANSAYSSQNTTGVYANSAFSVANQAYTQANSAFLEALNAYNQANWASLQANGAFIQANAVYALTNTTLTQTGSSYGTANGSFVQANVAYSTANSSGVYANGAFAQANAAFIKANTPPAIANSAATYANGAFVQANGAFAQTNAAFNLANTAILTINGTSGRVSACTVINFGGQGYTTNLDMVPLSPNPAATYSGVVTSIVVDNYGRITQATACTASLGSVTQVTADTSAGSSSYTYPISVSNSSTTPKITVNATGVSSGTYGGTSGYVTTVAVDQFGRITSISGSSSTPITTVTIGGTNKTGSSITISSTDITNALGFTPYSAANPSSYITSSALSGYATQSYVTGQGYLTSTSLSGYATQSYVTGQGYITSSSNITGTAYNITQYPLNQSVSTTASPTFQTVNCSTLSSSGDVIAYASSDKDLKTNVEEITDALDKVKQLTGFTYNWNDKAVELYQKDPDQREAGIFAQDVQKVQPEVVATRTDGTLAVRYEKLVPLLIEAIKELSDKVEMLESKNTRRTTKK